MTTNDKRLRKTPKLDRPSIQAWVQKYLPSHLHGPPVVTAFMQLANSTQLAETQAYILHRSSGTLGRGRILKILRAAARLGHFSPGTGLTGADDKQRRAFLEASSFPHPLPAAGGRWPRRGQGRWESHTEDVRSVEQQLLRDMLAFLLRREGLSAKDALQEATRRMYDHSGLKALPNKTTRSKPTLSEAEKKRLAQAVATHPFYQWDWARAMYQFLCALLAAQGYRATAALGVPISAVHIDWDKAEPTGYIVGKMAGANKRNPLVRLTPRLVALLQAWLDVHPWRDDADAPLLVKPRASWRLREPIAMTTETLSIQLLHFGEKMVPPTQVGIRSFRRARVGQGILVGETERRTNQQMGRRGGHARGPDYFVPLDEEGVSAVARRIVATDTHGKVTAPEKTTPASNDTAPVNLLMASLLAGVPDRGDRATESR